MIQIPLGTTSIPYTFQVKTFGNGVQVPFINALESIPTNLPRRRYSPTKKNGSSDHIAREELILEVGLGGVIDTTC